MLPAHVAAMQVGRWSQNERPRNILLPTRSCPRSRVLPYLRSPGTCSERRQQLAQKPFTWFTWYFHAAHHHSSQPSSTSIYHPILPKPSTASWPAYCQLTAAIRSCPPPSTEIPLRPASFTWQTPSPLPSITNRHTICTAPFHTPAFAV